MNRKEQLGRLKRMHGEDVAVEFVEAIDTAAYAHLTSQEMRDKIANDMSTDEHTLFLVWLKRFDLALEPDNEFDREAANVVYQFAVQHATDSEIPSDPSELEIRDTLCVMIDDGYAEHLYEIIKWYRKHLGLEEIEADHKQVTNDALEFACGHPEYKDGHCAVMSCSNYINKHE